MKWSNCFKFPNNFNKCIFNNKTTPNRIRVKNKTNKQTRICRKFKINYCSTSNRFKKWQILNNCMNIKSSIFSNHFKKLCQITNSRYRSRLNVKNFSSKTKWTQNRMINSRFKPLNSNSSRCNWVSNLKLLIFRHKKKWTNIIFSFTNS